MEATLGTLEDRLGYELNSFTQRIDPDWAALRNWMLREDWPQNPESERVKRMAAAAWISITDVLDQGVDSKSALRDLGFAYEDSDIPNTYGNREIRVGHLSWPNAVSRGYQSLLAAKMQRR